MYKIQKLNKISPDGLKRFPGDLYEHATDIVNPDAILVRSADMHAMDLPQSLLAIARDNANNRGKGWKLEGGIGRDASNNTALMGTVSKTTLFASAGTFTDTWDIQATADDTNEALKIDVTPDTGTAKTIRWTVTGMCSEVRFA